MVKNQSYYAFVKYVSDIIFLWCPLQYSIFATLRILFYDTKGKRGVAYFQWSSLVKKRNEYMNKTIMRGILEYRHVPRKMSSTNWSLLW